MSFGEWESSDPVLTSSTSSKALDYYPPQTTQPFAVLDSLFRLGLAKPDDVELSTLDISSRVNLHLENARKNAAQGHAYTVQLPWYTEGRWSDDFRVKFTQYWQHLGSQIGTPTTAIPVPQEATGFATRAVANSGPCLVVSVVKPIDMNIVFQQAATLARTSAST